ncbi:MAG: trypsin-like peptidase domain-containing protein [Bryobacteraceae bacterium]
MEPKIIIRHRNGGKAGSATEFPLDRHRSLSLGRDPSCEIALDQDKDDVVSRMHSKISISAGTPPTCQLSDLGSRNGTFLNKQRISGEVALTPGDIIQLGPGGPELEFDLEPRPAPAVKPTRLATQLPPPAMTREAAAPPPIPSAVTPVISGPGAAGPSKATVERMIATGQKKNSMQLVAAIAAIAVVGGGAALYFARRGPAIVSDGKQTPAQISAANTDSVVYFEAGWKIVDVESGRQLYQVAMPNKITDQEGQSKEIIPNGPPYLPAFMKLEGGIEPLLSTDDGGGKYKAIGGMHSGSGFVVSSDGFVLTNRHVAATWFTRYHFPDQVGVVLDLDQEMKIKNVTPIGGRSFPAWVPADAKLIIQGTPDSGNFKLVPKSISGKLIEGRNDYLDVTFAKNRVRVPAKLARVSDQIDVAMVKVDLPRSLRKVELFDNYDKIAVGDPLVVLGYPGVSPVVVGAVQSKDVFRSNSEAKVIPDPTLSVGNVGRVIRGQAGFNEATYSTMGDVIQLTINSTGGGNSGGPVFDDKGRVIGIFTSGTVGQDATITFAVPIRYGMELMGTNKVM